MKKAYSADKIFTGELWKNDSAVIVEGKSRPEGIVDRKGGGARANRLAESAGIVKATVRWKRAEAGVVAHLKQRSRAIGDRRK